MHIIVCPSDFLLSTVSTVLALFLCMRIAVTLGYSYIIMHNNICVQHAHVIDCAINNCSESWISCKSGHLKEVSDRR